MKKWKSEIVRSCIRICKANSLNMLLNCAENIRDFEHLFFYFKSIIVLCRYKLSTWSTACVVQKCPMQLLFRTLYCTVQCTSFAAGLFIYVNCQPEALHVSYSSVPCNYYTRTLYSTVCTIVHHLQQVCLYRYVLYTVQCVQYSCVYGPQMRWQNKTKEKKIQRDKISPI